MKNKLILIALFALFFAPVLVAVVLHSEWIDWQAAPDKAHGELIEPVVALGEFELTDAGGVRRDRSDLTGRWQLVHAAATCGEPCLERLQLMHNIRLAQDRRLDEVGLVLLAERELVDETIETISGMDRNWLIFDGAAAGDLLQRFPDVESGAFYILDPKANIMERFDPGDDLNGIRKDLDRLLTWTVREQE